MQQRNENPGILIDWFDDFEGAHRFDVLSNFHIGEPIDMGDGEGAVYMTGEHAFAAYKASTRKAFDKVLKAKSPGAAKSVGRTITLRSDWEHKKFDVMTCVLAAKFASGRPEADVLLETGDALLVEGTHWGDRVWGVAIPKKEGSPEPGRNWLGRLLMAQRATLRAVDMGVDQMALDDIETYTLRRCAPRFLDF